MSAAAAGANDAKFTFDAAQAEYYEHTLTKGIFLPWASKLFDVSRPAIGDNILDVATGTGVVAIECAKTIGESVGDARGARSSSARRAHTIRSHMRTTRDMLVYILLQSLETDHAGCSCIQGKVLAVDSSAGMLARAKAKAPEPGAGTISWLEADATAMTLPIESFDRAYCQQGLQFMPNPTEAMKRVLKALKPGGHFTCAVWSPATEKSNVIMYHLGQALMDVGRARWFDVAVKPMSWSTTTDGAGYTKLEDALIAAGFTNPDVCVEDGVFEFADMDTAVAIAKVGPYGAELVEDIELWDAFAENFANRLRPYVQPDGSVVTPARSYVGHGVAPWN